jgi:hypothetical protein
MPTPADAGNRELETAIDALYQGPLDQFTAERNALAASLKKSGDKVSAERVKALAKPSSTAWAVNQAWWHHRDRFQAMLDAGAAQRKAHIAFAQGKHADVRAAGEARRAAVSEVTEAALQALGGHKAVAPDVQYRIAGTVEALASSGAPEGELPGRLTRDLQSSGLDALTALAEAAGPITRPTIVARGTPAESTPPRARSVPPGKETPAAPRARGSKPEPAATESARERRAREAEEAAERTRASQLTEARTRASESRAALEAATDAASETAAEETSARAALDAATKRRVDLEAALDDARADEAAARRALSSATAAASRAQLDRARADRDATRVREALERLEGGK